MSAIVVVIGCCEFDGERGRLGFENCHSKNRKRGVQNEGVDLDLYTEYFKLAQRSHTRGAIVDPGFDWSTRSIRFDETVK